MVDRAPALEVDVERVSRAGRQSQAPASLFRIDEDIYYLGTVNRWGRYKNTNGQNSHGYYIHYDEGDRYWMIESNVHKYVM